MFLNVKLIVSTFLMIFLAELGDKTQISIFALATNTRSMLSIFIGGAGALLLTTLIAVLVGGAIGRFIPEKIIKLISAAVFIAFGALTLYEALKG